MISSLLDNIAKSKLLLNLVFTFGFAPFSNKYFKICPFPVKIADEIGQCIPMPSTVSPYDNNNSIISIVT